MSLVCWRWRTFVALTPHRSETSSGEGGVDTGPIARVPLHDAIVTRLRDMIIEGVLAPGSRVNEGQIGAQLGISCTPLREAIKFLASEGLSELAPGRGAIVRAFSKKDVCDMLVVLRLGQECLAGNPRLRARHRRGDRRDPPASRRDDRPLPGAAAARLLQAEPGNPLRHRQARRQRIPCLMSMAFCRAV